MFSDTSILKFGYFYYAFFALVLFFNILLLFILINEVFVPLKFDTQGTCISVLTLDCPYPLLICSVERKYII